MIDCSRISWRLARPMRPANDNTIVDHSLRERQQAIKICEAQITHPIGSPGAALAADLLLHASPKVADLICLVLVSLELKRMPPTVEQWHAAAGKLRDGWNP